MNWKKRVRKIAEEKPDSLHPLLKNMGNKSQAIATAKQLAGDEKEISIEQTSKALLFFLKYLKENSLLNKTGINWMNSSAIKDYENIGIFKTHLSKEGLLFSERVFDVWFTEYGINMILGANEEHESQNFLNNQL